jgi:serine/threonine protein kinase
MIIKTISGLESKESLRIEIEKRLNLSHPCILGPIGFISGTESTKSGELKLVKFSSEGNSLAEVISLNPVWWTATAKAKSIARIVLSLRFLHSLGLFHGHLNSKHIVFDMDHQIQIADFYSNGLEVEDSRKGTGVFSDERWSPDADIRGFALILFEIIVGHPAMLSGVLNDQEIPWMDIPVFVSKLMASAQSPECEMGQSFNDIFNILKNNRFEIMSGVDSVDVLTFVDWVESFE